MVTSRATQAVGVTDLERDRVAQCREPALAAGGVLAVDEVVQVVEELLQLLLRERSPPWRHGVIARVARGVPVEGDLRGHVAEGLLTEVAPAVGGRGGVGTEHRDRVAVGTQRRETDRLLAGAALGHVVVQVDGPPRPRERAGVLLEPAQHATAALDRLGGQSAGQHLRLPAVEHRVEHAIFGSKQTDLGVSKYPRNEARNSLHDAPRIRGNLHLMQETYANLHE
jgi:hypothetical protein